MYYVGVDLGGTNIAIGIVDEEGKILHKDSIPTKRERHSSEIIKDMGALVLKLLESNNIKKDEVKSIGVGSPGVVDAKNGKIVVAYNIGFKNTPLKDEMELITGIPVFVENDANCAALAECFVGAAKGYESSVTVTLGTGIGSGIIINGKPYSGFASGGGEVGHTVIGVDGEPCTCGRRGCWEAYGSATALIRQTQRALEKNPDSIIGKLIDGDVTKINAKTAFDALRQGDETGKNVVNRYIEYVAEGVANLINLIQPEIILIGGGVSKEGEFLLVPLREMVSKKVFTRDTPQTKIMKAEMGNDAGIVGAAMLGKLV